MKRTSGMAFMKAGKLPHAGLIVLALALSAVLAAAPQSRKRPAEEAEAAHTETPDSASGGLALIGPDRIQVGKRVVLRARVPTADTPQGRRAFRWSQVEGPALKVREVKPLGDGEQTVVLPFDFGKCTGSFITFIPAEAGSYQIQVAVRGAAEAPLVATRTLVVVDPDPVVAPKPTRTNQAPALVVSIKMSPLVVTDDSSLILQATAEGGPSTTYNYQWAQTEGPAVNPANGWLSRNLAFTPGTFTAGTTYGFRVTVHSDNVAGVATLTVPVQ